MDRHCERCGRTMKQKVKEYLVEMLMYINFGFMIGIGVACGIFISMYMYVNLGI